MKIKPFDYHKFFLAIAWLLIILSAALLALSLIFNNDVIKMRYQDIQNVLYGFENRIIALENKWIILIIIELLFLLKTIIPIPLSVILVISGAIFPNKISFIACVFGLSMQFLIRYIYGFYKGGGNALKWITKYDPLLDVLEHKGKGNPWILFVLRLVPIFPVNLVSRLYGSWEAPTMNFVLISICGMLPRVISLIWFGNNIFNPFSANFFIPLIILLAVSGISILGLNTAIRLIKKSKRMEELYEVTEEI